MVLNLDRTNFSEKTKQMLREIDEKYRDYVLKFHKEQEDKNPHKMIEVKNREEAEMYLLKRNLPVVRMCYGNFQDYGLDWGDFIIFYLREEQVSTVYIVNSEKIISNMRQIVVPLRTVYLKDDDTPEKYLFRNELNLEKVEEDEAELRFIFNKEKSFYKYPKQD